MIMQQNDFSARLRKTQKLLSSLPQPSAEAQALSAELSARITAAMTMTGGSLPFWKYMNMALYEPGLGYYSAGSRKLGAAGDFVTAAEISELFSRTLARVSQSVLNSVEKGEILEVGAGSGIMAATILSQLAADHALPEQYHILELSAELRQRQQQTLNEQVPDLAARVHWCDQLPENFSGLILANELLDALPAHRFIIEADEARELSVTRRDNDFIWQSQPGSERLIKRIGEIEKDNGRFAEGYVSEILFAAEDWIHAAAKTLTSGMILLLDYGQPRSVYYHAQRNNGTLSCHYRHRRHDDPFFYPGLQDITAHVDFTAIADAALAAGLEVAGYTTQAHFLLGSGITDWLAEQTDRLVQLDYSNQIKKLTLPEEMGETFKVMGLRKNCTVSLPGFMLRDMRERL